jgi:hypothetical protein
MNLPRRHFLGSSLIVLGSTLMDALTTPLWKWQNPAVLQAAAANPAAKSPVTFVDVAREAGLNAPNVWGAADHKRYIIEAKGSGLAFFDYDHDGWLDIYLTNGTHLDGNWPAGKAPLRISTKIIATELSPTLRRNPASGARAGRPASAWATTTTTVGTTYSAVSGDTTSCSTTTATEPSPTSLGRPACTTNNFRWGAGCTFLDYDRDGHLDLFVCNYIKLDPAKAPSANDPLCQWKGIPVMCGPRGLPGDTNVLYHNNGDGTFTDVVRKVRHPETRPALFHHRCLLRLRQRRLAGYLCRSGLTAQHAVPQQSRRNIHRYRRHGRMRL